MGLVNPKRITSSTTGCDCYERRILINYEEKHSLLCCGTPDLLRSFNSYRIIIKTKINDTNRRNSGTRIAPVKQ